MAEGINLLIGILVLLIGIPLGDLLAKWTKEELKAGQIWFKLIIVISLIGGLIGLIIEKDVLLFSFLFIAIVTSRSLQKKKNRTTT